VALSKSLAPKVRGRFIVLDGVDGAGKSTHHRRLEQDLSAASVQVVSCRDPGGTTIGDRIRSLLLGQDLSKMDVNCETMLFMASRAQLIHEVIRPALAAGKTVLCDRFVSSTCAYQGAAGYDPRRTIELARFALSDLWPHVTIVLDIPVEKGLDRIGRGRSGTDAMESRPMEFHRRVREIFRNLPEFYPAPVVIVDASSDADTVYQRILEGLERATF